MKNINRDYLVTVNVKTAEVTAPSNMSFYITDINTCNIFFELIFNKPENISISDYINKIPDKIPKEDISNYTLTLRILRPDGIPINIGVDLLDQGEDKRYGEDLLYVDLEPEHINKIGNYDCELFIVTKVNGLEERNTTNRFAFTVIKSIFSELDEAIESDPDYPLIADIFATKEYVDSVTKKHIDYAIDNMDLYGYVTRDYINQVVAGGEIDLTDYVKDDELSEILDNLPTCEVDLTDYVTKKELDDTLVDLAGGQINLSSYATIDYVDEAIANIEVGSNCDCDLSVYATKEELDDKADKVHEHNQYATVISLNSKADKLHIHNEYAEKTALNNKADREHYHEEYALNTDLDGKADRIHEHEEYVTKEELEDKDYATKSQIPTKLPANGGNAHTVNNYSIWVGTQDDYDKLTTISDKVLYFIKEY